jgi:transposase
MRRHALTDEQWARLQDVLPKKQQGRHSAAGDRHFLDAVIYRARTGVAWRDLPERFGPWKTIYNRFSNWARRGWWEKIFKTLQFEVDEEGCIMDGSVIRAHQDAAGGKGGSDAMLWAVLEEVFLPSSMPSSTPRRDRSTSSSRRASSTKPPSLNR